MAVTQAKDKYYLRSLHEEISLYDRKLAHLQKYDTFASEKERTVAATKLTTKRDSLVRTAKQLVEEGVEFKPSELPRSLRDDQTEVVEEVAVAAPVEASPAMIFGLPVERPVIAAHENTVLNFRNEMKEYMDKRRKAFATSN